MRTKNLCEAAGHDWRVTTASNYRVCRYPGCRAAQHLRNGQWVDVAQRQPHEQDQSSRQLDLFQTGAA